MLADQLKSKNVGVDSKELAAAERDPFLTSIDSLRFSRLSSLDSVRRSTPIKESKRSCR